MKKIIIFSFLILLAGSVFGQSYNDYLAKAKDFEAKKLWCQALGAYYDALGTDEDPIKKKEAFDAYIGLADAIREGKPGRGTFDEFTSHDEWKKLVADTEKYVFTFPNSVVLIGDLQKESLDYQTRTATYSAGVAEVAICSRYNNTVGIVEEGYKKAFKKDWAADMPNPEAWPPVPREIYTLNIIDGNGNEVVKAQDLVLGEEILLYYKGIKPELFELLDSGRAWVNPVSIRNEKGKLPMDKAIFDCYHYHGDPVANNFEKAVGPLCNFDKAAVGAMLKMIQIPGGNYEMLKTEVTQALYEAVMGDNPSKYKGNDRPVGAVSWYDAINFCNMLSLGMGLEPVYSGNGDNVTQDTSKNGFRLPTADEWEYAAKGGEDYKYAGSNRINEVAWYTKSKTKDGVGPQPVAQKKPNGYGLYDMTGNVEEWCWDPSNYSPRVRNRLGGCIYSKAEYCLIIRKYRTSADSSERDSYAGFRIVRTVK